MMQRIMALMLSVVLLNQSVSMLEEISPAETGAELKQTKASEENELVSTEEHTAEISSENDTVSIGVSQEETEAISHSEMMNEDSTSQTDTNTQESVELPKDNKEESEQATTILEEESASQTKESEEGTTESTKENEEATEPIIESEEETEELTSEEESEESTATIETEGTALPDENKEESTEITEFIETVSETEQVFNVSLPASTNAYLDPGNLSGKGQIFSDQYTVENYGNTDIAIKIKNIEIHYNTTKHQYKFSSDTITENYSTEKKLNVELVWKNETEHTETVLNVMEGAPDEEVLLLKAAAYDENNEFIALNPGSTGVFYFTGTMNANTNIEWEAGDIVVSFDYEIVCAEENYVREQTEDIENSSESTEEEQETMTECTDTNIEKEQETSTECTDINTEDSSEAIEETQEPLTENTENNIEKYSVSQE